MVRRTEGSIEISIQLPLAFPHPNTQQILHTENLHIIPSRPDRSICIASSRSLNGTLVSIMPMMFRKHSRRIRRIVMLVLRRSAIVHWSIRGVRYIRGVGYISRLCAFGLVAARTLEYVGLVPDHQTIRGEENTFYDASFGHVQFM